MKRPVADLNCLSALMSVDTVPYFRPYYKGVKCTILTADGFDIEPPETPSPFFAVSAAFSQVIA